MSDSLSAANRRVRSSASLLAGMAGLDLQLRVWQPPEGDSCRVLLSMPSGDRPRRTARFSAGSSVHRFIGAGRFC